MSGIITTGEELKKNAICIIIQTTRLGVRRTVAKEEVTVEATGTVAPLEGQTAEEAKAIDQDLTSVAKELFVSKELRAIANFDDHTKAWFKKRSVKSPLLRSGAYIFDANALPQMYDYLEGRAEARKPLIATFKAALPTLIADAQVKLGPLFNADQYPSAKDDYAAVDSLFTFGWSVVEISTPDKKLRAVSQAIYEKEKAKAERTWQNAIGQINEALAVGMAEVVDFAVERLGDGTEAPKRFRAGTLAKVNEFLDTFAQRNLSGNMDLNKLVEDARNVLNGVDAKAIKNNDAVRANVVEGFAKIKASLGTMLEAKPGRAIALATDEAV